MTQSETLRKTPHAAGVGLRLALVAVVLSALVTVVQAAQMPRPVSVDLGSVRALVPALQRPDGRMLSAKGVSAALGWRWTDRGDGDFALASGEPGSGVRFDASLPGLVQGPWAFWRLQQPAVRSEGDLFLSRADVQRVRRIAERTTSGGTGKGEPNVRLTLEAPADQRRLALLVEPSGDLARGSATVEQDAASGHWMVRIPWEGPPRPAWPEQRVGHPLLQGVFVDARREALTLLLEPGARADRFEVERDEAAGIWRVAVSSRRTPGSRSSQRSPADGAEVRRIVLDPGHGGEEDGAIGSGGVVEKELVLDVARRARAKLRTRGFEVSLTREGDVALPLDARAGIANREKADVFVSIHANAARYRGARGAETYFLAREATDDAARTAAALENNASGARLQGTLDGDLPLILWDMAQTEYLAESQQLAELIQARLNQRVNLDDRGVRQAPFRVLVGATCPAVLVELGFLSHPEEEKLLAQPAYRDRLALALTEALETFARSRRGAPPDGLAGQGAVEGR